MAETSNTSAFENRYTTLAGLFTFFVGLVVLLGWFLDLKPFARLSSQWTVMKFETALGFFFSGLGLFLTSLRSKQRYRSLKFLSAAVVFLIGVVVLLEYSFHWNSAWERLFTRDDWDVDDAIYPGRMSPITALHFVIVGFCLFFFQLQGKRRVFLVQGSASLIALISSLNIIGYFYGVDFLYANQAYMRVGFHVAVTFFVLALGILIHWPDEGIAAVFLGKGTGSKAAWRVLPAVILIPVFLGALIEYGQKQNWYDPLFAVALLVSLNFLFLVPLIVWQAVLLNREAKASDKTTRLLLSIMRNMSEGVLVMDREGKLIYYNQGAQNISDIRIDESADNKAVLVNQGVYKRDRVTFLPVTEIPLIQAIHGEDTDDVVLFLKNETHPKGIYISSNGRALRDENGAVTGGLVVMRNINEQLRKEERLKAYAKRLEESNRDLEDFIFVASHDLQEPLRKIQAFGGFLLADCGDQLNEKGKRYIEKMSNASNRMQGLIEDLLSLARVTTKAKPFVSCDLSVVVHEVLGDLEARIQQTGAQVDVDILPVLEADPVQMRQLFQNLIGNSLKYHRPGVAPVIRVRALLDTEIPDLPISHCAVRVEDNGIGFEPEYAEQIFKAFERLHGKEAYEGTGIGLAICRKVIDRHGGTIKAEGVPEKGSRFTVILPLNQAQSFRGAGT